MATTTHQKQEKPQPPGDIHAWYRQIRQPEPVRIPTDMATTHAALMRDATNMGDDALLEHFLVERPKNLIYCPENECWYQPVKKVFIPWEEPGPPTEMIPDVPKKHRGGRSGMCSITINSRRDLQRQKNQERILSHLRQKQEEQAQSRRMRYLELVGKNRGPAVSWSRDSHPPIQTARHVTSRYRH